MDELDLIVNDLTSVPEAARPFYEQVLSADGTPIASYKLKVRDVVPTTELTLVTKTLSTVREEKKAIESNLKAFGDYTPDKVKQLEQEYNLAKTSSANPDKYKEEVINMKRAMQEDFANKESEYVSKIEELTCKEKDLNSRLIDMNLTNVLNKTTSGKLADGAFDMLLKSAREELKYNQETGTFTTDGGFSGVDEWFDSFSRNKRFILKESQSAGAKGNLGSGKQAEWVKFFEKDTMNITKQLELKATDPALFSYLKKTYITDRK